jgi:hypothetical protein
MLEKLSEGLPEELEKAKDTVVIIFFLILQKVRKDGTSRTRPATRAMGAVSECRCLSESSLATCDTQYVQKLGDSSAWAPHIRVQPETYSTPNYFSEDELEHLQGSPLQWMYSTVREELEENFEQLKRYVYAAPLPLSLECSCQNQLV